MVPASGAEKIGQKRRLRDDRGAGWHLAVKNAKGIGSDPSAAIPAELLFAAAQKREDRLAEGGPAFGATEGIDLQIQALKPEFFQKMEQHQDQLRIGARVIRAEDLGIDLMELPVTPLLRPLAPEHRANGVELRDRFGGMEAVFQVGTDDGSGRLRPERQGFLSAVEKGVHLFFNDISGFSDSAAEELRLFKQWYADLPKSKGVKNLVGRLFDMTPLVRLRRKNILETSDGGNDLHRLKTSPDLLNLGRF